MKITKDHQNRDVYRACIDRDGLMILAAERVAKEAGIDLTADGVSWNGNVSGYDTVSGYRFEVLITITDDHTKKVTAA